MLEAAGGNPRVRLTREVTPELRYALRRRILYDPTSFTVMDRFRKPTRAKDDARSSEAARLLHDLSEALKKSAVRMIEGEEQIKVRTLEQAVPLSVVRIHMGMDGDRRRGKDLIGHSNKFHFPAREALDLLAELNDSPEVFLGNVSRDTDEAQGVLLKIFQAENLMGGFYTHGEYNISSVVSA